MQIRMMQARETWSDLVYSAKFLFTFDDHSKLRLLMDRNEELKSRQQEWNRIKQDIINQTDTSTLEQTQMAELLRNAHWKLISDEVSISNRVGMIQMNANKTENTGLLAEAQNASRKIESSSVLHGLSIIGTENFSQAKNSETGISITSGGEKGKVTAEEAKRLVEEKTGIEASEGTIQTKEGKAFFVVTGNKSDESGGKKTFRSYEAWVDPETGAITAVSITSSSASEGTGSRAASRAVGDQVETSTQVSEQGAYATSSSKSRG